MSSSRVMDGHLNILIESSTASIKYWNIETGSHSLLICIHITGTFSWTNDAAKLFIRLPCTCLHKLNIRSGHESGVRLLCPYVSLFWKCVGVGVGAGSTQAQVLDCRGSVADNATPFNLNTRSNCEHLCTTLLQLIACKITWRFINKCL